MRKFYQCPICQKIFYEQLGAMTCMVVHGYNPLTKRFCKAPVTQIHLSDRSITSYNECFDYAYKHSLELGENYPDESNMFIAAMRQTKVIEREHSLGICASCQYKHDDAFCEAFPRSSAFDVDTGFTYCNDYQPHDYYGRLLQNDWHKFREQQLDEIPF